MAVEGPSGKVGVARNLLTEAGTLPDILICAPYIKNLCL